MSYTSHATPAPYENTLNLTSQEPFVIKIESQPAPCANGKIFCIEFNFTAGTHTVSFGRSQSHKPLNTAHAHQTYEDSPTKKYNGANIDHLTSYMPSTPHIVLPGSPTPFTVADSDDDAPKHLSGPELKRRKRGCEERDEDADSEGEDNRADKSRKRLV
jgi:hypothetical protein